MSTIINNGNKKYTFVSPQKQCFSFPLDVISSMLKQPSSSNGLLKLYQTCKYFYSRKQILIFSDTKFDRRSFCFNEENPKLKISHGEGNNYADFQHLLWHTGKLEILHFVQRKNGRLYLEKNRIPKFYRCSIKELELNHTILSLDDFKLITGEKQIEIFYIGYISWICYPDYSKVDIAEILRLELMPKLYSLRCSSEATNYTNKVIEKFGLLQLQTKLSRLFLCFSTSGPNLNNDVNKSNLLKFLRNNADKNENVSIILTTCCREFNSDLQKIVQKWKNEITV